MELLGLLLSRSQLFKAKIFFLRSSNFLNSGPHLQSFHLQRKQTGSHKVLLFIKMAKNGDVPIQLDKGLKCQKHLSQLKGSSGSANTFFLKNICLENSFG